MNLCHEPYAVDFMGNRPSWEIKTSPYLTPGRRYSRTFALTELVAGISFEISTPHGDFTWSILSSDNNDSVWTMAAASTIDGVYSSLEDKLLYNYEINEYYDVSISLQPSAVYLTIKAKSEEVSGPITAYLDTVPLTILETVGGLDRTYKDGYKIAARLQAVTSGKKILSPWMYFDDNNGKVSVRSELLQHSFVGRDVPQYAETAGAYCCNKLLMQCRVLFAELYDGVMRTVKRSNWRTLINGEIGQYEADNNIPDWLAVNDEKLYRKNSIDLFGQDNEAVVHTDTETEQYLYISNFTSSDIGPLNLTVESVTDSGTTTSTAASLTFTSGTVSRVPVGVTALGLSTNGLVSYSVSIPVGASSIRRRFVIISRPYHARTLLVVNRTGVYESFVINNVTVDRETSGDKVSVSGTNGFVITEANTTVTARTGRRTRGDFDILMSALAKKGNLLLDGRMAWEISIKPGTVKIVEENEDLLEAEISFVTVKKINRQPLFISAIEENTVITHNDNVIRPSQSR